MPCRQSLPSNRACSLPGASVQGSAGDRGRRCVWRHGFADSSSIPPENNSLFSLAYKKRNQVLAQESVIPQRGLIICGPSGVGKGTLIEMLMKEYPADFGFSGETNGVHYHFVDEQTMKTKIANGDFIEYASVHGKFYGTSFGGYESVSQSGKICVLDIDVQGHRTIQNSPKLKDKPHSVFVAPPSHEALEQRLRHRATDSEEVIQKRLHNAFQEIDEGTAPGNFDKVIVNDDLKRSYNELKVQLIEWYPQLKKE